MAPPVARKRRGPHAPTRTQQVEDRLFRAAWVRPIRKALGRPPNHPTQEPRLSEVPRRTTKTSLHLAQE
eukprot:13072261-Alexandrium_andersonii.AAC.1